MAQDRPKKVALIGATGYQYGSSEARVECFPWDRLKKAGNLADYDVLILNLLSVETMGSLDADAIMDVLSVRTMLEVLVSEPGGSSGSSIVVLGDPRGNIVEAPPEYEQFPEFRERTEIPFLFWTGMDFKWDERPGDTVECGREATRGPFKPFADKLGRWQYSLEECHLNSHEFSELLPTGEMHQDGFELKAQVEDICRSRYHTSIVFRVQLVAADVRRSRAGRRLQDESHAITRPIYFLPESQLSEGETLEFVLRELCGVDVSAPEPEWIEEISVPSQERVDEEILDLERQIEKLIEQHSRKLDYKAELRRPLELLYQSGAALEEAVWYVLEQLGAEVERPDERNKEDGWLTARVGTDILEGVLEVKSTDKEHFGTGGLRQLFDWINRGVALRKKRYTGIFVGNSSVKDPPKSRPWPFNKNWIEDAELYGFAAIRTEDLYVLYLLDKTSRLDRDQFWLTLFRTKGPIDMRPHWALLSEKEKAQLSNLPRT